MPFTGTWPAERIETLKALYATGASASVIAEALSTYNSQVTRNMVCGKIDRLGLPKRIRPELTPDEIRAKRQRERDRHNRNQNKRRSSVASNPIHKHRAEKIRMEDVQELPPLNLKLDELTMKDGAPAECRFPTNDDMANATFCGHAPDGGSSYCCHHRMRCTRQGNYIGSKYVPTIACAA